MSNEALQAAFKKYQTIVLPILAVIIAIAIFVLVVVPQGMKIPQTNQEIQNSQKSLDDLNTKLSTLQSIDTQKFKDDLDTSFKALPQDPDIPGIFDQIFTVLTSSGLALNDVNISQTQ